MTNTEPFSGSDSAHTLPPCSSTACLTMASPRPVPPCLRLLERSARLGLFKGQHHRCGARPRLRGHPAGRGRAGIRPAPQAGRGKLHDRNRPRGRVPAAPGRQKAKVKRQKQPLAKRKFRYARRRRAWKRQATPQYAEHYASRLQRKRNGISATPAHSSAS